MAKNNMIIIFLLFLPLIYSCATVGLQGKLKVSRSEAVKIAQDCLASSSYKNQYYSRHYYVNLNSPEPVWGILFKAKEANDTCMYGALVDAETGQTDCQCLYGM